MTPEKPHSFEAIYRVEQNGSSSWVLQLENNQVVTVTDVEIRLYASRESLKADLGEPIGIISRKVVTEGQAKLGELEQGGTDDL